jgi:HEAT repeat protein/putative zinc finger protein
MNCDWIKENAANYAYDELADDQRHEFERHVNGCAGCQKEVDNMRAFLGMMRTGAPVVEPSPSLLTASRMRLQEALEHAEQSRGWTKWAFDVGGWMNQMKLSPALAAVLLVVGFTGGAVTTFTAHKTPVSPNGQIDSASLEGASIASIKGITQDPSSNKVEINYDRLVPAKAEGSVEDPQIQKLLLFASRSNLNSGVRMDSVDVLTQNPDNDRVREALIFALRYDKNPGVRLKALEGLKNYVKKDRRVRDVMLEALVRDDNAGVRAEAIKSLQPVMADTSVRATLQDLADRDKNKFIRYASQRALATAPEVQ